MNTRQCKVCKETKQREQSGKFTKGTKKWVDESGFLWNGKTCPVCNTARLAVHYVEKKMRAQGSISGTEVKSE